jgi:hypothetical protein
MKKRFDMTSSLHRKEFYDENFNLDNKTERQIRTYEIKNTDHLDIKEFENIFAKKGIHIYGLKATSNFAGGNVNSSLTFNIRETEKLTKNFEYVKTELDEKGFKLKKKDIRPTRSQ